MCSSPKRRRRSKAGRRRPRRFPSSCDPATARAIVESEDIFEFDGKGGFTLVSSPVAVMDAEGGEANAVDFSALTDEEICGVHRAQPGDISRTLAAEGKE